MASTSCTRLSMVTIMPKYFKVQNWKKKRRQKLITLHALIQHLFHHPSIWLPSFVKPLMSYNVILKLFRSLGTKTGTSKETNYFDVTDQKAAFEYPCDHRKLLVHGHPYFPVKNCNQWKYHFLFSLFVNVFYHW